MTPRSHRLSTTMMASCPGCEMPLLRNGVRNSHSLRLYRSKLREHQYQLVDQAPLIINWEMCLIGLDSNRMEDEKMKVTQTDNSSHERVRWQIIIWWRRWFDDAEKAVEVCANLVIGSQTYHLHRVYQSEKAINQVILVFCMFLSKEKERHPISGWFGSILGQSVSRDVHFPFLEDFTSEWCQRKSKLLALMNWACLFLISVKTGTNRRFSIGQPKITTFRVKLLISDWIQFVSIDRHNY
jgi:hypothetical protein